MILLNLSRCVFTVSAVVTQLSPLLQESQVSVEVAIPQRYHRAIMGPKGCRIQHITREHEVQIKFPERDDSAAGQKQNKQEKFNCSCDNITTLSLYLILNLMIIDSSVAVSVYICV